jgi:DNA-binding XRE family transcriptional regulator
MTTDTISPPAVQFSGHNLRVRRVMRRLNQTQLGAILPQSPASIRDWEYGRALPSVRTVCRLAEVLDCKIEDLFEDTRS